MPFDPTRWWPIALSADIAAATVHPVMLGGAELALWRDAGGAVRLFEDRCPHRGMRLSFGFVRGDRLTCLYHGWDYGGDGRCLRIPAHPDLVPPETIRPAVFRVVEAGGLVFAAGADAPAVPALPPLTAHRPVRSLYIGW